MYLTGGFGAGCRVIYRVFWPSWPLLLMARYLYARGQYVPQSFPSGFRTLRAWCLIGLFAEQLHWRLRSGWVSMNDCTELNFAFQWLLP
jgi:hypothetical protein